MRQKYLGKLEWIEADVEEEYANIEAKKLKASEEEEVGEE
jgi:hypothetical protein